MNALVPITHAPPMTVSDVERVALAIAKGGLFGCKDPNAVLTLCLLAQAEGQHPAVVFRDYHIIQGKPAKKAEAMLRDFINAGGKVEWHTMDDECADATFSHPSGSVRIDWTLERAKKAGLATAMWSKYPRQMLRSRVISEGVRAVYPGATSGLYVEEEVRDFAPASTEQTGETSEAPEDITVTDMAHGKVGGITKIKARLRDLRAHGDAETDLEAFNSLVHGYKEELTKIKDANHDWWTGDDADFEGFKAWIVRRREELSAEPAEGYKVLLDGLAGCETKVQLQNFVNANCDTIEGLEGPDSRKFELAYQFRESLINTQDAVNA